MKYKVNHYSFLVEVLPGRSWIEYSRWMYRLFQKFRQNINKMDQLFQLKDKDMLGRNTDWNENNCTSLQNLWHQQINPKWDLSQQMTSTLWCFTQTSQFWKAISYCSLDLGLRSLVDFSSIKSYVYHCLFFLKENFPINYNLFFSSFTHIL